MKKLIVIFIFLAVSLSPLCYAEESANSAVEKSEADIKNMPENISGEEASALMPSQVKKIQVKNTNYGQMKNSPPVTVLKGKASEQLDKKRPGQNK